MAYTIYNTDGTALLTLDEGKIDQETTSLTLVGRNVNSYGEYLNNDLVKLLGNFASENAPANPIVGQLWYDKSSGRMKVYDLNNQFRPVTNSLIADAQPDTLASGDFWFDSANNQMYFSTDGQTVNLIGPTDSSIYGRSGWRAETIRDTIGNTHQVTSLYNSDDLVGMFSTEAFTFAATTGGMRAVSIGLNLNPSLTGIRFVGTATSADSISGINISQFVRKDQDLQAIQGSLTIIDPKGLVVASDNIDTGRAITLSVNSGTNIGTMAYNRPDSDFRIRVTNASNNLGLTTAIYIKGNTRKLGVWNENPTYDLDVAGDVRVRGNLQVEGTSTNVTTVNLQVKDKNIELAAGQATPSDSFADGGGFTLHGTNDHIIQWKNNNTGWNLNDNLNITTDATPFTSVTATSITGTNATFDIVVKDGVYLVSLISGGSNYANTATVVWTTSTPFRSWTTATPFVAWTTATPFQSWTTSTPFVTWSTTTPFVNNWTTSTPFSTSTGWTTSTPFIIWTTSTPYVGAFTTSTPYIGLWNTTTPYVGAFSTSTPYIGAWSTTTPANIINSNVLTIYGTQVGGASPTNDITLTVNATTGSGVITGFTYSGSGRDFAYLISSSTVLTRSSLGAGITSAPGITKLGTLVSLTVTNILILGNTIATVPGTGANLVFNPDGAGVINFSTKRVTNIGAPAVNTDAATKKYVDDSLYLVGTKSFAITLDVTNFVAIYGTVAAGVKTYLDLMFPIANVAPDQLYDLPDGVRAKVLCATVSVPTTTATVVTSATSILVDKGGVFNSANVLSGLPGQFIARVPPQTYTPVTTYTVQTWKTVTGVWTFIS